MNILSCRKVYPLCPIPKSGRPIHPPLKRRGLSGPRFVIFILFTRRSLVSGEANVQVGSSSKIDEYASIYIRPTSGFGKK